MKMQIPDMDSYRAQIDGTYREKFRAFYEILTEFNQKYNLTSIKEEPAVYEKHFLDSVAGEYLFPANASVVEIGSGAGFPSLPLKIIRPDLRFTLVESVGKKCAFLRAAVERLGITDVSILNGRAEDFAKDGQYREKFDCCTARAVAEMRILAEYCLPFVRVGGKMIAYKGDAAEEIARAENALGQLGAKLSGVAEYKLYGYTGEESVRTLAVACKERATPAKYPRGNGMERKKPL